MRFDFVLLIYGMLRVFFSPFFQLIYSTFLYSIFRSTFPSHSAIDKEKKLILRILTHFFFLIFVSKKCVCSHRLIKISDN